MPELPPADVRPTDTTSCCQAPSGPTWDYADYEWDPQRAVRAHESRTPLQPAALPAACPPRHPARRLREPNGGCLALARHGCPSPALSPTNARLR